MSCQGSYYYNRISHKCHAEVLLSISANVDRDPSEYLRATARGPVGVLRSQVRLCSGSGAGTMRAFFACWARPGTRAPGKLEVDGRPLILPLGKVPANEPSVRCSARRQATVEE